MATTAIDPSEADERWKEQPVSRGVFWRDYVAVRHSTAFALTIAGDRLLEPIGRAIVESDTGSGGNPEQSRESSRPWRLIPTPAGKPKDSENGRGTRSWPPTQCLWGTRSAGERKVFHQTPQFPVNFVSNRPLTCHPSRASVLLPLFVVDSEVLKMVVAGSESRDGPCLDIRGR
ncbi:uncharacterized protein DNG_02223 [Cephalotrichum gorgonifer]|uniref:Uncharacterized protein n=1 Tax=Cephalotrichum gorgonifer TaxID=2041049 RepID=A0AAE8MT75_9PEZI|nr:uncharacterized protein DNG_02223 [Cephalotrichum gorgonifer]